MRKDHKRMCFFLDMNAPDLTDVFPIKDQKSLMMFLSNFDGDFQRRKTAFEAMLYEVATKEDPTSNFSTTLMNTLFSRSYLREYKWPTTA